MPIKEEVAIYLKDDLLAPNTIFLESSEILKLSVRTIPLLIQIELTLLLAPCKIRMKAIRMNMMSRNEAKLEIKHNIKMSDFLTKSKGTDMYCCPFCNSGSKIKHTGALKVYSDTNRWYCHECGAQGDVIDLYRHQTGADFNTALADLAAQLNITLPASKIEEANPPMIKEPDANNEQTNFTDYCNACRKNLYDQKAVDYLAKRKILMQTAEKYGLGYDPEADPMNAPGGIGEKKYPEPRIIIPVSKHHYVARTINDNSDFPKLNPSGSNISIFNESVLYTPEVKEVYVVEGIFDALTIDQCGYAAIALNSINQVGRLIKQLEIHKTNATLYICLDNDAEESTRETVKKQLETLKQGLDRLEIAYKVVDITGGYKDVNEFLQADHEQCQRVIETITDQNRRPDNVLTYIKNHMASEILLYKGYYPTGFKKLDADSGGLKIGLYVLAAIPSLGKTTFALQTADQAAAAGYDVIFFSLEMSRLELVSKSLSRITMLQKEHNDGAVTSTQIRNGQTVPINRTNEQIDLLSEELNYNSVQAAIDEYTSSVGNRLSIVEGNFSCSISSIRSYVQNYINRTGCRPVVIIDYLQILQPEVVNGKKQTTKEAVDMTVTDLKRLSRELSIPIIAISSVNRMNYTTPISYESLKESGSIEYGSDVIWGMQLHCLSDEMFEKDNDTVKKRKTVNEAKAADPREIDVVCLKNRFGKTGLRWSFKYYPAYDLFIENEIT